MSIPNNPPAFPRTGEGFGNPRYDAPGMSLRDWFAGQCDISAYGPAEAFRIANRRHPTINELAYYIARIRYIEADAMLTARSGDPA